MLLQQGSLKQPVFIIGHDRGDCDVLAPSHGNYSVSVSPHKIDFECSIYLWSPPEYLIEIEFLHHNTPCDNNNNYISVHDYWSWYEQVFPVNSKINTEQDRLCNDNKENRKIFRSSQNGAMIKYRFNRRDIGQFHFAMRFIPNNEPCTIFIAGSETTRGSYHIENKKAKETCALYIIQSPRWNKAGFKGMMIRIDQMNAGDSDAMIHAPYPVYCSILNRGVQNFVEIGGYGAALSGYSTKHMQAWMETCNEHFYEDTIYVLCPNVVVRLFSTRERQHIKFTYEALTATSFMSTKFMMKRRAYKLECLAESINFPQVPVALQLADDISCSYLVENQGYHLLMMSQVNVDRKCKILIHAPIEHSIHIKMVELNINKQGDCYDYFNIDFVQANDGWIHNRETIPNIDLKSIAHDEKTTLPNKPLCVKGGNREFESSQNIAEIDFYLPDTGYGKTGSPIMAGFAFTVKFVFEPNVCDDVYLINTKERYTTDRLIFQDYRSSKQCTFYFIKLPWLQTNLEGFRFYFYKYSIGQPKRELSRFEKRSKANETDRCTNSGSKNDLLRIEGGKKFGLTSKLNPHGIELCSSMGIAPPYIMTIMCPSVGLTLYSSLNYYNFMVFDATTLWTGDLVGSQTNEDVAYCENKPLETSGMPLSLDYQECEQTLTEPGYYSLGVVLKTYEKHCYLFIRAPKNLQTIEIEITSAKFVCNDDDDNYLRIYDGWRYKNGLQMPRVFNSTRTLEQRIHKMCKKKHVKITLSQNFGQIEYRIIRKGWGHDFKFKVSFKYNPEPCDQVYLIDEFYAKKTHINFTMINNNIIHGLTCTCYIMHVPWIPYPNNVVESYEYSGLDIQFGRYELPDKSKFQLFNADNSCSSNGAKFFMRFIGSHQAIDFFRTPDLRGYEVCGNQNDRFIVKLEWCWNFGIELISSGNGVGHEVERSIIEATVHPLKSKELIPLESDYPRSWEFLKPYPALCKRPEFYDA
ncbi:hypothetical protein DERF_013424 [Dermatophagoides farinae]|uniref:Corticotropin-releasing factor-binding protein n=1 Tax=Dermatophagoides farinae TaxID=6954 RepID=A0A922L0I7_DERFA|nr:hypothetical protein DERF_013424 [Dermatophagoides farinae]